MTVGRASDAERAQDWERHLRHLLNPSAFVRDPVVRLSFGAERVEVPERLWRRLLGIAGAYELPLLTSQFTTPISLHNDPRPDPPDDGRPAPRRPCWARSSVWSSAGSMSSTTSRCTWSTPPTQRLQAVDDSRSVLRRFAPLLGWGCVRRWRRRRPGGRRSVRLSIRLGIGAPLAGCFGAHGQHKRTGCHPDGKEPTQLDVADHSVMTASVDRLVNFARDKLIVHVLGTHIEQRGPYRDYVVGTFQAPDEQPLAMSYGQLLELQQGAHVIGPDGKIVHQAFRDFSICGQYPTCTPLLPDGTPRPPQ
jgi:hypothetical protein